MGSDRQRSLRWGGIYSSIGFVRAYSAEYQCGERSDVKYDKTSLRYIIFSLQTTTVLPSDFTSDKIQSRGSCHAVYSNSV